MRFEILDSERGGKPVRRPQDYYLNGDGRLFYDCDPYGVDMSGKRRIVGVDSNRFTVVAAPSASTNTHIAQTLRAIVAELEIYAGDENETFIKIARGVLLRWARQIRNVRI